jgi:hypothetical protein
MDFAASYLQSSVRDDPMRPNRDATAIESLCVEFPRSLELIEVLLAIGLKSISIGLKKSGCEISANSESENESENSPMPDAGLHDWPGTILS